SRDEAPSYMPVVRFKDPAGVERQFQSRTGGGAKRWPLGTRVPVLFDALDPDRAEIAAPVHFWTAPVGVLLFGLIALFAAWKASSG
ncbi:MAG TPA: DUF3592 domain-containing protein, partial [Rhizomicrobium sp.]|nr:DUF3592 domain-containing protein [Rhizomicrobium sp.]